MCLSGLFLYENIYDGLLFPFSHPLNFNIFSFFILLGCSVFVFKNLFQVNAVFLLLNCLVLIPFLDIYFSLLHVISVATLHYLHHSGRLLIFVVFHIFYISWCPMHFTRQWGMIIHDAIFLSPARLAGGRS